MCFSRCKVSYICPEIMTYEYLHLAL
uniref:Uncharacterized protein n=1 Tax=Arundo donax TaxID=35708 RepID=A0A0A8ZS46_ARUDO